MTLKDEQSPATPGQYELLQQEVARLTREVAARCEEEERGVAAAEALRLKLEELEQRTGDMLKAIEAHHQERERVIARLSSDLVRTKACYEGANLRILDDTRLNRKMQDERDAALREVERLTALLRERKDLVAGEPAGDKYTAALLDMLADDERDVTALPAARKAELIEGGVPCQRCGGGVAARFVGEYPYCEPHAVERERGQKGTSP